MDLQIIQNKIFEVRGYRVMLDLHLAELYQVETRALKQAVKRNIDRFPSDFMFELSKDEWLGLITNCDKFPDNIRHTPTPPMAFTEQGVAMLSSVLRSKVAIEVNISIMRAFVLMRQMAIGYEELSRRIEELEVSTAELLSVQLSVATGETCPCPKCGSGRILFYPKVAKCSNVDCTLTIFRNKCDKQLSDKQIVELVTKRKTGLIKGFKGKNGKAFDASLVLDEQFNVGFSFPEKKAKPKK